MIFHICFLGYCFINGVCIFVLVEVAVFGWEEAVVDFGAFF
jgi:hypothetical protein